MSLESVLATMTYKPTYSFEVVPLGVGRVLRVTMRTHDSRPDEAPPLSVPVDFPVADLYDETGMPDDFWQAWLRDKIAWCELHESAEWLRFDGVLVFDPHEQAMIR